MEPEVVMTDLRTLEERARACLDAPIQGMTITVPSGARINGVPTRQRVTVDGALLSTDEDLIPGEWVNGWLPDLSDPLTVASIALMLREKTQHQGWWAIESDCDGWMVFCAQNPAPFATRAETEAEAWVLALEKVASND